MALSILPPYVSLSMGQLAAPGRERGDARYGGGNAVGEDCSSIVRPMLAMYESPVYSFRSCPACISENSENTDEPFAAGAPKEAHTPHPLHDRNCVRHSERNYGRTALGMLGKELQLQRIATPAADDANRRGSATMMGHSAFRENSQQGDNTLGALGYGEVGDSIKRASPSAAAPLHLPSNVPQLEKQLQHLGALHRLLRVDAYFATHLPSSFCSTKVPPVAAYDGGEDGMRRSHLPQERFSDMSSDDIADILQGKDQAAVEASRKSRRKSRQSNSRRNSQTAGKGANVGGRGVGGSPRLEALNKANRDADASPMAQSLNDVSYASPTKKLPSASVNFQSRLELSAASATSNVSGTHPVSGKPTEVRIVHNNTAYGLDHRTLGRVLRNVTHDAVSNKGGVVALSVAAQAAAAQEDKKKHKVARQLHDDLHASEDNDSPKRSSSSPLSTLSRLRGDAPSTTAAGNVRSPTALANGPPLDLSWGSGILHRPSLGQPPTSLQPLALPKGVTPVTASIGRGQRLSFSSPNVPAAGATAHSNSSSDEDSAEDPSMFVHDSTTGHRGQRPTLLNRFLLPSNVYGVNSKAKQRAVPNHMSTADSRKEDNRELRLALARERMQKLKEVTLDAKATNVRHPRAVVPSLGKVLGSVLAPPLPAKLVEPQPSVQMGDSSSMFMRSSTGSTSHLPQQVAAIKGPPAYSLNKPPRLRLPSSGHLDRSSAKQPQQSILSPASASRHALSPIIHATHHQKLLEESRRHLLIEAHEKAVELQQDAVLTSGRSATVDHSQEQQLGDLAGAERKLFLAASPRAGDVDALRSPPSTLISPHSHDSSSQVITTNHAPRREDDNTPSSDDSEAEQLEADANRQAVRMVSAAAYHSLSVQRLLKPLFREHHRRDQQKAKEERHQRRVQLRNYKGGAVRSGEESPAATSFANLSVDTSAASPLSPGFNNNNTSRRSEGVARAVNVGESELVLTKGKPPPPRRPLVLIEALAKLIPPSLPMSTLHTQLLSVLGPANEDLVHSLASYLCFGLDIETGPMVTLGPGTVPVSAEDDEAENTKQRAPKATRRGRTAAQIERLLIARCKHLRHGSYSGSVSHTLEIIATRLRDDKERLLSSSGAAPHSCGGGQARSSQQPCDTPGGGEEDNGEAMNRTASGVSLTGSMQAFVAAAAAIDEEDDLESDDGEDADPEDGDERLLLEGLLVQHRKIGSSAMMDRGVYNPDAYDEDPQATNGAVENTKKNLPSPDEDAHRFNDPDVAPLLFSNKPSAQALVRYEATFEVKGANPWLHAPPSIHVLSAPTPSLVVGNPTPNFGSGIGELSNSAAPVAHQMPLAQDATSLPPHAVRRHQLINSLKSNKQRPSCGGSPTPTDHVNLLDVRGLYDDSGLATHKVVSKRLDQRVAMINALLPPVDYLPPPSSTAAPLQNEWANKVVSQTPTNPPAPSLTPPPLVSFTELGGKPASPLDYRHGRSQSPYQAQAATSLSLSPLVPRTLGFPVYTSVANTTRTANDESVTTIRTRYSPQSESQYALPSSAFMLPPSSMSPPPTAELEAQLPRPSRSTIDNQRTAAIRSQQSTAVADCMLLERTLVSGTLRTQARTHFWGQLNSVEEAESRARLEILHVCQQEAAMKMSVLDADFEANVGWKTRYDPARRVRGAVSSRRQ